MGAAFGRPHKGGPAAFGGRPTFVGTIMDGYCFICPSVFAYLVHHIGYLLTYIDVHWRNSA